MHGRASEEEGEIERVSVVGRDDSRFGFSDVLKEATESSRLREGQGSGRTRRERDRGAHLVGLVENREWPFVLWLRRVLKVLDIGADNLAIGDEESLCA